MAYVYDPNLDEQKNKQNGNQPDDSSTAPPTGPGISGQAGSSGAQSQPGQPASSRNFVNLQSYLDANQGKNFGEQVAGKIDTDVNSAKQQTQTASKNFGDQVNAGTTNYDDKLVGGALADPAKYVANPPASSYETGSAPASSTNTDAVSAFQKQLHAQYQGPDSYSQSDDFNRAASANDAAFRRGESTKSEGGRMALLDEYFSRPTYSSGEKGLDNLLLQADPQNQAALATEAEKARALPAEYQDATTAANLAAQTGKANTVAAAQKTADALGGFGGGGAIGSAEKDVADHYAQMQADAAAAQAAYKKAQGNLMPGMAPGVLYGVDPNASQFVTTHDATADQTATEDQRARLAALATLAGVNNPHYTDGAPVSSLYSADPKALSSAVLTAKGSYDGQARQIALGIAQAQKRIAGINNQIKAAGPEGGNSAQAKQEYSNALTEQQALINKLQNQFAGLNQVYGVNFGLPGV